jgi:hypothetical protein
MEGEIYVVGLVVYYGGIEGCNTVWMRSVAVLQGILAYDSWIVLDWGLNKPILKVQDPLNTNLRNVIKVKEKVCNDCEPK